jgi:hypothetical protein
MSLIAFILSLIIGIIGAFKEKISYLIIFGILSQSFQIIINKTVVDMNAIKIDSHLNSLLITLTLFYIY